MTNKCNIKSFLKVQIPRSHSYRGVGRRVTHEGFIRQHPTSTTGSLPQPTRARHASLPRGRLGEVGEEGKGKKRRERNLSLAPHLRLESQQVGGEMSEEVGLEPQIGKSCENETKTIGRENLAKWRREIEREEDAVIQREILTPLRYYLTSVLIRNFRIIWEFYPIWGEGGGVFFVIQKLLLS